MNNISNKIESAKQKENKFDISLLLSNLSWKSISSIVSNVFQLIFTITLARLLNPSDFGLVAMALTFNRLLISLTNFSFGSAVIQSVNIDNKQISTFFYFNTFIFSILSIVCYYNAQNISIFFNEKFN